MYQTVWAVSKCNSLTYFRPMFPFYTPWNHQKTSGFVTFSGGIERNIDLKWVKMFGCVLANTKWFSVIISELLYRLTRLNFVLGLFLLNFSIVITWKIKWISWKSWKKYSIPKNKSAISIVEFHHVLKRTLTGTTRSSCIKEANIALDKKSPSRHLFVQS